MKLLSYCCIIAGGALMMACKPALQTGAAYFENFTYEGNDAIYADNPLPGTDAVYNPILPGS